MENTYWLMQVYEKLSRKGLADCEFNLRQQGDSPEITRDERDKVRLIMTRDLGAEKLSQTIEREFTTQSTEGPARDLYKEFRNEDSFEMISSYLPARIESTWNQLAAGRVMDSLRMTQEFGAQVIQLGFSRNILHTSAGQRVSYDTLTANYNSPTESLLQAVHLGEDCTGLNDFGYGITHPNLKDLSPEGRAAAISKEAERIRGILPEAPTNYATPRHACDLFILLVEKLHERCNGHIKLRYLRQGRSL